MASTFTISIILLLLLTTAITTVAVAAVPEREYYSLLSALRYRGYQVFANAITTTDLHYDITTGGNFTFFAPIDSVLYTLDMSMSAGDYATTMRFHVVPYRLRLSDLRRLPYGLNSIPTLLRDHQVRVVNPLALPLPITVEGVDIAVPDLYYDEHVVVHGLESVIDFRSVNDSMNSSSVAGDLTENHFPMSPPVAVPLTEIGTGTSPRPVPKTSYLSSPDASQAQHLHRQPETKSESITQSHQSPETTSESIIQSHHSPEIYVESITQPREEHVSIATRSELTSQRIHHVSLATKSTVNAADEFTPVDDTIVDCPIAEDDDEQLSIANIRRGDPYTRELYASTKMTCAHE